MRINIALILMVVLCCWSCSKEEINESEVKTVSNVPSIQLVDVSPQTVKELEGDLKFTINYTDGDGDLGFEDADEKSLEIKDLRADLVNMYHVPPVTPNNEEIAVQGTFEIILENVILIDPDALREVATFEVRLKDRAGNWSNAATSGEVVVTK